MILNCVRICCFIFFYHWLMVQSAHAQVTEVKYYSRGNSPGLWPYQNALLLLALEKTRKDFGDYEVTYYSDIISSSRAKIETERGKLINLHYSTGWRGNFVNENNVIKIRHPILKGLLGMRSLVIRENDLARFRSVNKLADLRRFSAGQGSGWLDVSILEANDFKVVRSEVFANLAPMLAARRFEFVPLSVLEAQAAVDSFVVDNTKLTVSPNIALFYPLPIYLCVSKNAPELAVRLDVGVARVIQDGSLDKLFDAHFSFVAEVMKNRELRTFLLRNHHLSKAENRLLQEQFVKQFGKAITIVNRVQ